MPDKSLHLSRRLLTLALAPSFYATEWLLVVATASTFSWLRFHHVPDQKIWLIFWAGNFMISGIFIFCNDLLGIDLTLMQSLRNILEKVAQRNRILGYFFEVSILTRLLVWDGPCQLLIFSRRYLASIPSQVLFLLGASGIQMLIWAKLYALGYENISDLFNH